MRGHGPLVALAAATVVSISGTRLSAIALPWLVLTTTGSPMLTGLVGLAEMLPYVVAKALSGPLIDRIGARRMSILSDMASTVAVAVVPLLYWSGLLSIWLLLPAVAVIGVLRAPSDAAKQALVPQIAATGHLPIERVTGILGASERLAGALGAAGAGALIALLGAGPALIVNAAAFAIGALVLAAGLPRAAGRDELAAARGYRAQLFEGWQFLRRDQVVMSLVIMVAITNLLDQAYAIVLVPVWAQSAGLDAGWVGLLFALMSGASIAGAAIAAAVGDRLPRLPVYTIAFLITGLPRFLVLGLDLPMPTILTTMVVAGLASGFLNPIIAAIMFERIPSAITGRVVALVGALTWALIPFGGVFAGVLVDGFGLAIAFGVSGALYFVATLAPIALPSFRDMRRREAISTA